MSIYLKNYWSLYSEFINIFNGITYKSIPIALATNFYHHIDANLRQSMEKKDFSQHLKHAGIHHQGEIQPFFEKKLNPIKNKVRNLTKDKIVINAIYGYTRLPNSIYSHVFDKKNAVVVSHSAKADHFGMPNVNIDAYKKDTKVPSTQLTEMVNGVLKKYPKHPAYGNQHFIKSLLQNIPLIIDGIEAVFNFFHAVRPKVVIIGTSEDIYSRAIALVGLMCGVPTICLQHGLLMGEEAFMPAFTTHLAVYGQYEKDWYVKRGLKADRIAIIGHPRYDELTTALAGKNRITAKRKILLTTGPGLNTVKFQSLISQLAANSGNQITLKPHPWEIAHNKIALYNELEKKYKNVKLNNKRLVNTNSLIKESDCVISSLSTVALEAMLLNKPSFVYYFLDANREYDYFNILGKYAEKDPKKLVETIELYFKSEKERAAYNQLRKNFLKRSYPTVNASNELLKLAQKVTF
ncbi:hypothetical protein IEO70_15040 [Bacillus sp. AGMB 02131]|uniref:Spore coat protein n=1 Tax=Peribacillus faecalis TaxID=2772559 RepID=A0A927CZT4_9BACI|nr:hypothetical protein [Peribacillus faecalis]MBD3109662.1 hypothetical protein [Peribacillus faecalis]